LGKDTLGQFGQLGHRVSGEKGKWETILIFHVCIYYGCGMFHETIPFDEVGLGI
jgi:hypothetical protein